MISSSELQASENNFQFLQPLNETYINTRTSKLTSIASQQYTKMNSTLLLFIIFCTSINICLADSGNLQDACPTDMKAKQTTFVNGFPCKNPSSIIAPDFKTSDINHTGDTDNFLHSSVNILTAADFPGLNTLGLSIARTDLDLDGMVMPHSHPRASELFFLRKGIVLAGFLDSNNTLFQSLIKGGDVFLFPRGLLHFCLNAGYEPATAFSVLNSQNSGVVSIAGALFETNSELIDKITRKLISVPVSELKHIRNATLAKFSRIHIQ
ncbi:PREDICTED: germin-like protein subfamily 3 member 4 [Theobroma cacao]|uniref:Germin-like protein n=1 Tax=Theobroma cacao TaxID=3641 RepID=A0AB32VCS7_THECC|nr:PREDICTED: germin-like protein subfamily 3 member 4 [Theobroma cacao]